MNLLDPDVRQSIAALLILTMIATFVVIIMKHRTRQRQVREKRKRDY